MRLALLGIDDEALELVRWGVLAEGHKLVAAYDVGSRESDVAAISPDVALGDTWESLVLGTQADAVIVARGQAGLAGQTGIADDERRADQFRKLAQAAVPMLVECPACEAIVGFEIEMIRRDSRGIIVPYVPGQSRGELAEVAGWVASSERSPVGWVEQLVLEREQADRGRAAVLVQFARDAALLRRLVGTIRSISASGPPPKVGRDPLGPKPVEPPALANLSVSLSGDRDVSVRWSIGPPAGGAETGRLVVVGDRGRATLHMPRGGAWSIDLGGGAATNGHGALPAHNAARAALASLREAIEGRVDTGGAWLDACRDQEAAEAIDRSLARGRTIELFGEEHTEEESFKGIMAMGGCLLLVGALGVVFVATIVEGLRLPLRDWAVWRYWPIYLLAPIAVFLMLQLLQLVIKKDTPNLKQLVGGQGRGS
jgi:hypothetical protein